MRRPQHHNPFGSPVLDDHRRHGRLQCDALSCSIGRVLDISNSGMRVLCRGRMSIPMHQPFGLTIHAPAGHFIVMVRAVWTHKAGFRQHEVGLEFNELTPASRESLALLARGAGGSSMGPARG